MSKWLSVSELAKQAQVPESTTRRYLTKFENFFRYEDRTRGKRYDPNSVTIIIFIQNLYSEGMEAEEIEAALSKQFPYTTPINESPSTIQSPLIPILATKSDLEEISKEVHTIHQEITELRKENIQLHNLLENRLEERDKRLVEAMQLILEARKEVATSQEQKPTQKKWFQFWK